MRNIILDNQDFTVLVFRQSDGRRLPITNDNWHQIRDAIELSVYESELLEISLRPDAESEANELNMVWLP